MGAFTNCLRTFGAVAVLSVGAAVSHARIVIEPRFTGRTNATGGAPAEVVQSGDIFKFDLVATVTGNNTNYWDETLMSIYGRLISSNVGQGIYRGDITAIPTRDFDGSSFLYLNSWFEDVSNAGGVQGAIAMHRADIDGDGDADWGPIDWTSQGAKPFFGIADFLPALPPRQEIVAGKVTFSVTSVRSGLPTEDTRLVFELHPLFRDTRWWSDGIIYGDDPYGPLSGGGISAASYTPDPGGLQVLSLDLRNLAIHPGDAFVVADDTTAEHVASPKLILVNFGKRLIAASVSSARLRLESGARVDILPSQGTPTASRLSSLSLDASATLNLADNPLILDCADEAGMQQALNDLRVLIGAARNADPAHPWVSPGLTSAAAEASAGALTLALIPNRNLDGTIRFSAVAGQNLDANDVVVSLTHTGDFNLDGRVDIDDYFLIDRGYSMGLGGYWNGDADYSGGSPDAEDYFQVDAAYLRHGGLTQGALSVPEPSCVGLLAATLVLVRRRRMPHAGA